MRIKKECILILLRSFRREFQHIMKKQAKNQLLEIRLDGLINDSIADNNKKNGKNTFIITFLNHKNILKFWPDICWDHKIVKSKRKLERKKKKKDHYRGMTAFLAYMLRDSLPDFSFTIMSKRKKSLILDLLSCNFIISIIRTLLFWSGQFDPLICGFSKNRWWNPAFLWLFILS